MKLFEVAKISERAGFIPYIIENGEPLFFFMKPSNPSFGGPLFQIAKGGLEKGETAIEAALREAKEELGLKRSNVKDDTIKLVWRGKMRGAEESYILYVFIGEVSKKDKFGETTHETDETAWLTAKEFSKQGRKPQQHIVRKAAEAIK